MAQGELTKDEIEHINDTVKEMHGLLPKGKRLETIGHLNDIYLFVSAGEQAGKLLDAIRTHMLDAGEVESGSPQEDFISRIDELVPRPQPAEAKKRK